MSTSWWSLQTRHTLSSALCASFCLSYVSTSYYYYYPWWYRNSSSDRLSVVKFFLLASFASSSLSNVLHKRELPFFHFLLSLSSRSRCVRRRGRRQFTYSTVSVCPPLSATVIRSYDVLPMGARGRCRRHTCLIPYSRGRSCLAAAETASASTSAPERQGCEGLQ